ncbi:hypothetical protein BAUCODRAFT_499642 [Baudoinia panamericana UAMH 10762]|uniref:Uncharacterized protein n=1 Tax=Baudoinia panamericana (strain UAMH 10762) TaxID=717646 RepID=M2MVY5_BAUPA|nr:uncharacterized protein BAUCODRAFT_499642 [Baudoinia panamericana UAMH 10762]EMC95718.1 hypothetical protein BAUCODRAFT_499642 [Baudoinia panamericana UAMH 10762]
MMLSTGNVEAYRRRRHVRAEAESLKRQVLEQESLAEEFRSAEHLDKEKKEDRRKLNTLIQQRERRVSGPLHDDHIDVESQSSEDSDELDNERQRLAAERRRMEAERRRLAAERLALENERRRLQQAQRPPLNPHETFGMHEDPLPHGRPIPGIYNAPIPPPMEHSRLFEPRIDILPPPPPPPPVANKRRHATAPPNDTRTSILERSATQSGPKRTQSTNTPHYYVRVADEVTQTVHPLVVPLRHSDPTSTTRRRESGYVRRRTSRRVRSWRLV